MKWGTSVNEVSELSLITSSQSQTHTAVTLRKTQPEEDKANTSQNHTSPLLYYNPNVQRTEWWLGSKVMIRAACFKITAREVKSLHFFLEKFSLRQPFECELESSISKGNGSNLLFSVFVQGCHSCLFSCLSWGEDPWHHHLQAFPSFIMFSLTVQTTEPVLLYQPLALSPESKLPFEARSLSDNQDIFKRTSCG